MNPTTPITKIVLSVLFLICLLDLPYGYYQFVRFAGFAGFLLLANGSKKQGKELQTIIFILLALLFQPFFKIALGRTIWNIVDLILAIGLIASIFRVPEKKSNE